MITKVSYGTIKNLGNYENEKVDLEAAVNEGEDPIEVLDTLCKTASRFLGIEVKEDRG